MQTVIQVFTAGRTSLRERIGNDEKLEAWRLRVIRRHKQGRKPGWAKIGSTEAEVRGTINVVWDGSARILTCRVVSKMGNKPSQLIGDFMAYLIERHRRTIRTVNLFPG
jgi:hypothetical protein